MSDDQDDLLLLDNTDTGTDTGADKAPGPSWASEVSNDTDESPLNSSLRDCGGHLGEAETGADNDETFKHNPCLIIRQEQRWTML